MPWSFFDKYGNVKKAASALVGQKLDYVERTTEASITATSQATANTVITGNSITLDGLSDIEIEFYIPDPGSPGTAQDLWIGVFDGATCLGAARLSASNGNIRAPISYKRRLTTPSAGAHQYIAKAWTSSGTGSLGAGAGGPTNDKIPMYLLVKKAS